METVRTHLLSLLFSPKPGFFLLKVSNLFQVKLDCHGIGTGIVVLISSHSRTAAGLNYAASTVP